VNPFESMQSLAALWGRGGSALAAAQQNMFVDMAERMKKAASGGVEPVSMTQAYGPQAQALADSGQAFAKLWSSALEISRQLALNLQQGDKPDPVVGEMLGKIFDPRGWFTGIDDMDEALRRMAEGPRLADLWEVERKMLAVFNAWVTLRKSSLEHNTVMLDAWMQAASAFAKELNRRADAGEVLESWRDLLGAWVETANTAILQTQRSEPYLRTQRDVLRASADLRLAQQEVAGFYSEMFGYPSRTELDDVHRTVTELRREVRALRRGTQPKQQTDTTAPRSLPSRPRKSKRASP
jgi:class III poly(R)-hydroxyalkanoic acid synthase PhaE subunit